MDTYLESNISIAEPDMLQPLTRLHLIRRVANGANCWSIKVTASDLNWTNEPVHDCPGDFHLEMISRKVIRRDTTTRGHNFMLVKETE